MKSTFSKGWLSILIVLGILIIDQIVKIEVKTNMTYNESIRITDWFYIRFIENNGMAFGMQIVPKAIQTLLRILFSGVIIWYISILAKNNYKHGYIACISLILAGAIGNIIDSIFYGVIFNQSTYTEISTFVPIGHGYAGWLHGKVVDMLYFPLCEFNWPDWIPFIGGDHFLFFSPVFNIADAAISCGVFILALFYLKSFNNSFQLVSDKFNDLLKKKNS